MSSDRSFSSSSSRLRQFGLYRSIDARTEEFLRLSRRRQIRQGCACAAISSAVTVTVVIIVLLICEYMIVVETNTVQKMKNMSKRIQQDLPVADKLDRSDFGFDQDYFERMPLLLNALQDNSYSDTTGEMLALPRKSSHFAGHKIRPTPYTPKKTIRKTSPQPFLFEYRSPYPRPFRKADGVTNSWTESYHNAQRLKNLNEVVKYLEKTLNAKFGDLYVPSETQIALSTMYVAPINGKKYTPSRDTGVTSKGSRHGQYWNHYSDPLFSFKPDNPSDVNYLVDDSKLYFITRHRNYARRRPSFDDPVNKCIYKECARHDFNEKDTQLTGSENINNFNYHHTGTDVNNKDPNNVYITTQRPIIQFRRKNIQPATRYFQNKISKNIRNKNKQDNQKEQTNNAPQLILHLNVYSVKGKNENKTTTTSTTTTTTTTTKYDNTYETTSIRYEKLPQIENTNLEVNATSVEDFHVGSSGIIEPYYNTQPAYPPTYPITTPSVPTFSTSESVVHIGSTNPPEIFKFSPEDAKIPDQYLSFRKSDMTQEIYPNLANESDAKHKVDSNTHEYYNNVRKSDFEMTTYSSNQRQLDDLNDKTQEEEKINTLIVRLKNSITSTTEEYTTTEDVEQVTETYVPQLNGHYRNMKHKNLSALLKESSERYRKRLEHLTVLKRTTYVPMYPENDQNRTRHNINGHSF